MTNFQMTEAIEKIAHEKKITFGAALKMILAEDSLNKRREFANAKIAQATKEDLQKFSLDFHAKVQDSLLKYTKNQK